MSVINKISVRIVTGTGKDEFGDRAGTDGEIYIGICSREFYIDSRAQDFEAGSDRTYILGDGANINYAKENDPRNPTLIMERIRYFPVYLRFEPRGGGPAWRLKYVEVNVNPNNANHLSYNNLFPNLWLGQKYGKFVFLSERR